MKPAQPKVIIQRLVHDEITRQRKTIEQNVISAVTAAFLLTLHDKYDFDKDKLQQIFNQVTEQFVAVKDNFVTIEDFIEFCENMGIVNA